MFFLSLSAHYMWIKSTLVPMLPSLSQEQTLNGKGLHHFQLSLNVNQTSHCQISAERVGGHIDNVSDA